jgi:methylenetetrahydrofolate dehydrogenase (NADP+)/methenyltetrahydrofolate cyclohydrolase
VAQEVSELKGKGINAGLAVVLVGDNPASKVYVGNKEKACAKAGIYSEKYVLPEDAEEEQLVELIDVLNENDNINGILVQLPLPKHIDEKRIIELIKPEKDVDCFHPYNVGRVFTGDPIFMPCTPYGVIELLKRSNIEISGKDCVVIGRSNIVGKPMGQLLLSENGTVTICHSKTADLKEKCKNADIIVVAIGKAKFLKADMVKPGAVVIDVGMNREDGKLCGDVDYDEVYNVASKITPVPGGVGQMTIAMLLKNTLTACRLQNNL